MTTLCRRVKRMRLSWRRSLEPVPPMACYERAAPGELLHIDTKRVGRINGILHLITGDSSLATPNFLIVNGMAEGDAPLLLRASQSLAQRNEPQCLNRSRWGTLAGDAQVSMQRYVKHSPCLAGSDWRSIAGSGCIARSHHRALGPVLDIELLHQLTHMSLDGLHRKPQRGTNFLVRHAQTQQ